jgi:RHS repeat-associated protein
MNAGFSKEKHQSNDVSQARDNASFVYNTQSETAKTKSNLIQAPSITLPKGGGAIKSIDEKFNINAAYGTAGFSVPLPFSPGRNGATPSLSLSYNSATGNSIFGLGWHCDYPAIQRRTDKMLPEYRDAADSDIFIFSGAEDLVPELIKDAGGNWQKNTTTSNGVSITQYRPRIEGSFARIEKIDDNNNVYWRVRTKENVVSVFGQSPTARITNPATGESTKIFKWCLEYTYDDKGNFTKYIYKQEDKKNIAPAIHEKNRLNDIAPFTNVYLKKVLYANKTAFYEGDAIPANTDFLFELVFDFGEHDLNKPTTQEINDWPVRQDPFSDYRPGFDIRTCRLCRRILMFHHFRDELGWNDYLVRSLDFTYDEHPHLTYLEQITQTGYIWNTNGTLQSKRSFPPYAFTYRKPGFSRTVKEISKEDILHDPVGLDNPYQWIDLYSEGISGILTEQATGWYYKENLGQGKFSPAQMVSPKPAVTGMNDGTLSIHDLEANGQKYLVKTDAAFKGFFALNTEDEWGPFTSFQQFPNINLQDPNLKFLDLNGDGMPDMLISHEQEFIWYAAKGKLGYDDYQSAAKAQDEEKGPLILFANKDESILIAVADMSGDGLADILIITNSSVSYYPNLGYGRFGARVTMQMNGCFDTDSGFNPQHIHLADIDGSGTTDIIYTGKNKIQVWYNQSGNSLKDPDEFFNPFAEIDNLTKIAVLDLLGNGTSCLVWSSPLPGNRNAPLRYIDLMNGKKPHLMEKYINNLGKEVTLTYKSSTEYYLEDKAKGKKWITRLPFPVQCISEVTVEDKVAQTHFTTLYSYHHGYYNGFEREFRGFAMVEQQDTEQYENYIKKSQGSTTTIDNKDLFQPAVTTKTWFHTGAYLNREKLFHQLQDEYYPNAIINNGTITDAALIATLQSYVLPETTLPAAVTADEIIECCRALKGLPLRQEVYSDEGDNKIQVHPYTVTQHNYDLQLLQPKAGQRNAVIFSHEKETLSINFERNPVDPRISHTINVETDQYGNVLQAASIVYGRKKADAGLPSDNDRQKQTKQYITYTLNQFTNVIDLPQAYRLPVPCEGQTWELNTNVPAATFFKTDEILQRFQNAAEKLYEQSTSLNEKRKIEHSKTLFLRDDLTGPLPFTFIDTRALPYENYLLAFTPTLAQNIYGGKFDESTWRNQARYIRLDGDSNYWINSGRTYFHPDLSGDPLAKTIGAPTAADVNFAKGNFFLPVAYEDNFGNLTKTFYDKYKLLIAHVIDALDNETFADAFNYRVAAPWLIRDSNNNRTGVRFNELGMVTHTFVMGKETEQKGDPIDENSTELSANDQPSAILEYVFQYYDTNGLHPSYVKTTVYEKHYYTEPAPAATGGILGWLSRLFGGGGSTPSIETDRKPQVSYSYSDGSGHEVLKKIQAEPGMAPERDNNGQLVHDTYGNLQYKDTSPGLRWVGNGRTIFNNKGNAVKQYEPFFDSGFAYNDEKELLELGFTPVIYYDSIGRVIRTDKPNGTFSKVTFDAWMQQSYDENDTVTDSAWYAQRINGAKGEAEQQAAQKAAVHYNTPATTYLDSLGRPFLSVAHNKTQRSNETVLEEFYYTRSELDIEGNALNITDSRGNVVMNWKYNMLGNICYQQSMDAGDRWMLADVMGKPLRLWNSRQQIFNYTYDELHRPLSRIVNTGAGNITFEQYEYGENTSDALTYNLKGKLVKHYDTAGMVSIAAYDFKGNVLASARQLLQDYKNIPDWNANPQLLSEIFSSETLYDALNRPVKMITPDNSIFTPLYNEANLLNSIDVNIKGAATATNFISNINYDAKGQREEIYYGNNTKTTYTYEPETYRLTRLLTTGNGNSILQDQNYTYDPTGNITRQFDNAQKTIFYGGQQVEAQSDYYYDAIYRLIEANGREHTGQIGWNAQDNYNDDWCRLTLQPNSPMQMRNYSQKYFYDSAGNITRLQHIAGAGSFTRLYTYNPANNQLIKTTAGSQTFTYTYNGHGSMLTMPQLQQIDWNIREEMQHVNLGGGGDAYYVYDSSGQRIRKVIERGGNKTEERIYIGPFEIYRERTGNTITLERETLHVMDDKNRVAMIDTRTKGNDGTPKQLMRYQYSNHLGSACLELDDMAAIISYEEYHPYGTTAYQATDASRQVPKKRYRYTDMERDEESGLNYHSARYYVPWLGRWLSADPIGIKGGMNLYEYCSGKVMVMTDTNGKDPGNVLSLGRNTLPSEKVAGGILKGMIINMTESNAARAQQITGLESTMTVRGMKGFREIFTKFNSKPEASGELVATALRGEGIVSRTGKAISAVHINSVGVELGEAEKLFHTSAELGAIKRSVEAGRQAVNVFIEGEHGLQIFNAGSKSIAIRSTVNLLAKTPVKSFAGAREIATALKPLRPIATATIAAAGKLAPVASKLAPVAKALAPVASKLAPVAKFLGKAAGPLGIGIGLAQIATAKNTEEKIDGGITAVSSALMMSKHPVAVAAGAGLMAGQVIEKTLDVSKYASDHGVAVYEGLKSAGVNDTVSFVAGGIVTVASTPVAIGEAAVDKTIGAAKSLYHWIRD